MSSPPQEQEMGSYHSTVEENASYAQFQAIAFNRTLSIKRFQSNAFNRTLSIKRFQSNAFNQTLSIYIVRTTGNFFHCDLLQNVSNSCPILNARNFGAIFVVVTTSMQNEVNYFCV